MTKQVQLRRGTTAEHLTFTGAVGELTIDTTLDVAIVHDGVSVGGHPLVGTTADQEITNKRAVGIGTTNATSELTVVGDVSIIGSGSLGARSLNISGRPALEKSGNISGFSTNIVSGISTDEIIVGDTLSLIGFNVSLGSSYSSIISSVQTNQVQLLRNFSSGLVTSRTGFYETISATKLVGIDTAGLSVGLAVTSSDGLGLGVGATIVGFGTNPTEVIISPQAQNTYNGGNTIFGDTQLGSNIITGIDTTGIKIGSAIEDIDNASLPSGTLVTSVGIGQIEVSNVSNATNSSTLLSIIFIDTYYFAPVSISTNFTVTNLNHGKADIETLISDNSYLTNAYVDSIYTDNIKSSSGLINFSDNIKISAATTSNSLSVQKYSSIVKDGDVVPVLANKIIGINTDGISRGDTVTSTVGSGVTVGNIINFTIGYATTIVGSANSSYTNLVAIGGSGTGALFDVSRDGLGGISTVTLVDGGSGYNLSDILSISGLDLDGTDPTDNLLLNVTEIVDVWNIGAGTSVINIGIGTVFLNGPVNTGLSFIRNGFFNEAFSTSILGIDTSGIQIGYGVTSDLISGISTVTQIDTGTIYLSSSALNILPEYFSKVGNISSGSSIITGISTNQIQVGSEIIYNLFPSATTVVSIGVSQVTTTNNATGDETGASILFGYARQFYIGSQSGITSSFTFDNNHRGRAFLDVVIGNTVSYSNAYITSSFVNSGIITTAGISSGRINNAYISSGVATEFNISTSLVDNLSVNSGVATIVGVTSLLYANSGIITEVGIGSAFVTDFYANSGIITNIGVTTGTADILYVREGITTTLGINSSFTNLAYINSGIITEAGISSAYVTDLYAASGIITNVAISTAGISTLFTSVGIITNLVAGSIQGNSAEIGNISVSIGNTDLIIDGTARVTGILTIGTDSVTIDGINSNISGVSSITGTVGVFTDVQIAGINTFNNLRSNVTLKVSNVAISTDYTLTLPPTLGRNGQLLGLNADGTLGFATGTGLYENRYYVSSVNGDDTNDGKTLPVKTIKKASQLASFDSFISPGNRYLDAGNLLEANKEFIKEEVVAYLEFNYENITTDLPDYDATICKRDVGYLVDSIVYDIRFGGNSKSIEAGNAYWDGATSYVAGEEEQAIFAYEYLKFIGQYIINNQTPPTLYQTAVSQSFDFTIIQDPLNTNSNYFHRSKDARNLIVGNRQEIIDKSLASVALAATTGFYFPGETESNERSRYYDSYKLIQINRQEIIDYAWNATVAVYPGISATQTKCKRDLGYFVDAVSTDVFTGGNNYARSFAGFYFDAFGNPISNGLFGEETESVYAFEQAKVGMSSAVCNLLTNKDLTITADPATGSNTSPSSCANVRSTISTLVGIVTSVISAGSTAGIGTTTNYGYFLVNSEFNVSDFVGIGTTNVVGGRKCARDLGYIVDAVAQDISYGTNQHIVYATKKYFDGAGVARTDGLAGEEVISGYAFTSLAYYSKLAVTNQLNYQDLTIQNDAGIGTNKGSTVCANTQSTIDSLVGILTTAVLSGSLVGITTVNLGLTDCADVRSALVNYVGIITTIVGFGTTAAPELSEPQTQSEPVCIIVEAGEYLEDNPILLYDDIAVVGDNLRNTIIRPLNAGKDLFRVRNGVYLTGFAMKDSIDLAGIPQNKFDYAVAFDDPSDPLTSRVGYATKNEKPVISRSPYIQNCSILSFLGANGILVDGNKVSSPNTPLVKEESEIDPDNQQPEQGKSMVAAAFTMVSFGGIGWRTINDGYAQVVSCFQIFCRYGSLAQSGGYLSITNSATNFGFYALRSTGFSRKSFVFDRGRIAATGTSGGLQTLKAIGYGRSDIDNYVLQFFDNDGVNRTTLFKPAATSKEVTATSGTISITNDTITIVSHGFVQGDPIVYNGDEQVIPNRIIGGLVNDNQYYVGYIDNNTFSLYEDEGLETIVNLTSTSSGIHTFTKSTQDFYVNEIISSGTHNEYQKLTLAGVGSTAVFVSGRQITQTVVGGTAVGFALTYNNTTRELIVGKEVSGDIRRNFAISNGTTNFDILDHSGSPISIGITVVTGISTYWTIEFKTDSTTPGNIIQNIGNLPETYRLNFHRPSIINSSSHTWEYSGSGIDYNALPENGGQTDPTSEQVSELGGKVYASGTNELGDFKIGDSITAYNRTGNIIFNNTVTIGTLDSLRLSLSGGTPIEEFSVDADLGDNELGGPQNRRVSTQLAVRTFLNNRLGNFIDKLVSANAIPNAVVQLNSTGQINADLIPPKTANYYRTPYDGGRLQLANYIPATNLTSGDTVVEPTAPFVLISDTVSEYLILNNSSIYNFQNGDQVVSVVSAGGAVGIVTAPPTIGINTNTLSFPNVGYGSTGLVRGVALSLNSLSGGSGYTSAGIYTGVRLDTSTGIGTGITATITVSAAGTVSNVAINTGGRRFSTGDILTLNDPTPIGGRSGGANFSITVGSVETRLYLSLTNGQRFPGSALLPDYISDRNAIAISTNIGVAYTSTFNPTDYLTGGSIDFTNDRIIVGAGHSFADGDPVIYSNGGGNTLGDLVNGLTYYTKVVGVTSVQLYTTYGLITLKDLNSSGTGTHSLSRVGVNTSTDQFVFVNHGLTQGDPVLVTGNTPTGITTGNFYFIGAVTQNSFSLHETKAQSLTAVNGLLLNTVDLSAGTVQSAVGIMTLTQQHIEYTSTINTSSTQSDNWSLLATSLLDASNIVSGVFSPSRLGTGSATEDTFLSGNSAYQKVVKSVGIGTTQPMAATATSSDLAPGGVGINTYYGDVRLTLNRVISTIDEYSTLGVSKFKTSTFTIGSDGAVSIKNSLTGDVDAATLGGQNSSFYLDITNSTGTIPISRGGTGVVAAPSLGYILLGNGSGYSLTGDPTFAGTVSAGFDVLANKDIVFTTGTWSGEKAAKIQYHSNNLYNQYTGSWIARNSGGTNTFTIDASGNTVAAGTFQATRLTSTQATGTAPFTVSSTTVVTNLNADLLDGLNSSAFMRTDANTSTSGTLTLSGDVQDLVNLSANSTNDNRGIAFNSRTALSADFDDGYLRLNNASEFTNGVYTPGTLRVDGTLLIDSTRGLTDVTGEYGNVQTTGTGVGSWQGYSISGRAVFMHDNGTNCGIYNDTNNQWMFYGVFQAATYMYYNGSSKFETTNTGVSVTGALTASSNITAYSSDRRLKENFKHIESPLEKVLKLNGYTFDWTIESRELGFIPKHDTNDIGLIAQEVEAVLPQAVAPAPFDLVNNPETHEMESKSGQNYLTVQYERIVPLLVEAIKEQNQMINNLRDEIESLKSKFSE